MLRIAILTLYPVETASTRQRIHKNIREFPADVEVVVWPGIRSADGRRAGTAGPLGRLMMLFTELGRKLVHLWRARAYDVIVVQKGLTVMNLRGLPEILFRLGPPVVFDFDDAVYLEPPQAVRSRLAQSLFAPRQVLQMFPRFHTIIAGNRSLAKVAAAHNPRVAVLGTPMDTDWYRLRAVRRDGRVVVGWSGASTTNHYVRRLAPILRRVAERVPGTEFRVISNDVRQTGLDEFEGVETSFVRWQLDRLVDDLLGVDIGLMPLDDDEWSRSKCGGKILQYMACGIPPVASPVGINVEVIEPGVTGFLAADDDQWVEAIVRLATDPDLRERIGRAARARIETDHSNAVAGPRLLALLRTAAASRKRRGN